eukprot:6212709-Pleurochrysis_carterae.AAC.8
MQNNLFGIEDSATQNAKRIEAKPRLAASARLSNSLNSSAWWCALCAWPGPKSIAKYANRRT